jgi:hypothetical protein
MQQFVPRTIKQTEDLVTREQGNPATGKIFSSGMFNDIPVIPKDAIAYSLGYIPFDRRLEPVGGCLLWSAASLPKLRTGLRFQQVGDVLGIIPVIVYTPTIFVPSEVGNFIINDDGLPARIIRYINANSVQVDTTITTPETTNSGFTCAQLNKSFYHKKSKKVLHHIGNELYVSTYEMVSYTKCICLSNRRLSSNVSVIEEQGDYAILACKEEYLTGGIFRIDMTKDPILYWRANCTNPATRITDGTETPKKTFKYKYTHTAAIIEGSGRLSSAIKHESGSCGFDSNLVDYGTRYSEKPIGPESDDATFDQIVGGTLPSGSQSPATWAAITNGQFGITIDGDAFNVAVDFATVTSMSEVAKALELALKGYNPDVTITYNTDHFVLTNPTKGGTLEYVISGTYGVNLLDYLRLHAAGGAVKTSEYYYAPIEVQTLLVPVDPVTGKPERQYTHLPLYRSLDFGADGVLKDNNEEQFMLAADVPAASVFVGSVSSGVLALSKGTLVDGDVGSVLRFMDGTEVEITTVTADQAGTVSYAYDISSQPSAIGGDYSLDKAIRIMTFTQSVKTLTRIAGDVFTSDDSGKVIFTPTGKLHVTDYVDADHVLVAESGTDAIGTAGAMDPLCRNWNDIITDDLLRGMIRDYSLQQRFNVPFPVCDDIGIDAGLAFAATRESTNLYYQEIFSGKEHLVGYYNPRQMLPLKDTIKKISIFPGNVVVYCGHSFYVIKTDVTAPVDINAALQILILYSIQWNEGIGIRASSAVRKLPNGEDWVFANDQSVRICDGTNMSDNLAKDRCMKILKQILPDVTIGYDTVNGVRIYGAETEGGGGEVTGGGYGMVPYGTGYYKDAVLATSAYPAVTSRCIGHAIKPEQGIGFYEIPPENMPMPIAGGSGTLEVFDDDDQLHSLVFDYATLSWYDISTRDGAIGTDLVKTWTGKDYTNFDRTVRFGEDKGTFEREFLRMLQAMVYFRPTKPENIDYSGYDSAGYPTGMKVGMNLYADGKLVPTASAAAIPFDGVVKHDKKVDAHRISIELVSNMGDHQIVGKQADYDNSKRAVEPDKRLSTELVLQKELAGFSLAPDFIAGTLRNRYNGVAIVSTGMTAVLGPESRKTCGIEFSTPITLGSLAMHAGSALFWLYGTAVLTVNGNGGTVEEVGADGSWHLIKVSGITASGAVVFTPTGTARIAHARFYSSEISDDAADYFLDDVVDNDGKIVLP